MARLTDFQVEKSYVPVHFLSRVLRSTAVEMEKRSTKDDIHEATIASTT